jgi:hypothetical protein
MFHLFYEVQEKSVNLSIDRAFSAITYKFKNESIDLMKASLRKVSKSKI